MRRRWILWISLIAFTWLVVSRFNEIERLAHVLAQGHWPWIGVALMLEVVYFLTFSALYQSSFDTVEVRSRIGDLLPLVLASFFVNTVAPPGGAALFIDDAARRGQSPARSAAGVLLVVIADFGAFLAILAYGLAHLYASHRLQPYQLVGAAVLGAITAGLVGLLTIGLWRPTLLPRVLGFVEHGVRALSHRLRRPSFLAEGFADRTARDFTEAARAIRHHPGRLGRTVLVALTTHAINLATMSALFFAFHVRPEAGVLVTGYAIGVLFWLVSLTPQGIGIVEGVMALAYASLDVPAERATLIALAFRGLAFWLPMAAGAVWMGKRGSQPAPTSRRPA